MSVDRARIIFHGGIVLFVGLLCGYPTLVETETQAETVRLWHTAHESLIMIGVLLFAISSTLPALSLEKRESAALYWSGLAMGYGFMIALLVGAIGGVRPFSPTTSPLLLVGFIGNVAGILGSFIAAALTAMGAWATMRKS